MEENKYRVISIGYKELYGESGYTIDQIRQTIGTYDLNGLFELSGKLGVILFHTSGDMKKMVNAQTDILFSLDTYLSGSCARMVSA